MAEKTKNAILDKLGIEALNEMQEAAHQAMEARSEIILLSPTGTGKTLAFLLPIVASLDPKIADVQALIIVPSRELAIQIEQVAREMGSGYKINAVYGGRSSSKDKLELKHSPAILIGTPGRVADHLRRRTVSNRHIKTLVLDEFDKSLEVGFEKEMNEILDALPSVKKKILTSATQNVGIPEFVGMRKPKRLNFLTNSSSQLEIKTVVSKNKDKLDGLVRLLKHLNNKSGIVFCNFKDTIQFVSDHLSDKEVGHVCFYGGLEQVERERALIKFRNGTHRVLLATDLAARGIDVPNLDYIIHYQLPRVESEFTHRNGRTARMNAGGTAYILKWENDKLYDFVREAKEVTIKESNEKVKDEWETLYISGGRKDKISKGDIAGMFFKQGDLSKEELGVIELKQDCAFVSVSKIKVKKLIEKLNNTRLKKKKVRITIAQ